MPELTAIVELWKRTRRTFVAQFDGASMRPTIEPQQAMTVRCGQVATVGDVVMAVRSSGIVVHRMVWRSKRGDWVLTRGDARTIPDLPLDVNDIIAVIDAPPYVSGSTQHLALRVVSGAGRFGRLAAAVAVRGLQILWWSRNRAGGTI